MLYSYLEVKMSAVTQITNHNFLCSRLRYIGKFLLSNALSISFNNSLDFVSLPYLTNMGNVVALIYSFLQTPEFV